jgi:hypothetical protein
MQERGVPELYFLASIIFCLSGSGTLDPLLAKQLDLSIFTGKISDFAWNASVQFYIQNPGLTLLTSMTIEHGIRCIR